MLVLRLWASRHPRPLIGLYAAWQRVFVAMAPLWRAIGPARLERPFAAVERGVKGLLFDCRMCGDCVISSTGLSCPMNCPKEMRNGPCGGVRSDGGCEVIPAMRCVWLIADEGSRRLGEPAPLAEILAPVDHARRGRSAWLRLLESDAE